MSVKPPANTTELPGHERWSVPLGVIGKMRDAFIVLTGVLYFFGFLTWGIYARLLDLGVAPPLRAQYFALGVPAMLVLTGAWLIFLALRTFLYQRWPSWFDRSERNQKIVTIGLLFVGAVAGIAYVYWLEEKPLPFGQPLMNSWFELLILLASIVLSTMLLVLLQRARIERYLVSALLIGELLIYAYAGMLTFVATVYIRWPQHLGGGAPICAQLDLYTSKLSPETLAELAPESDREGPVVKSQKLSVIHTGGTVMVLGADARYELRREDIAAIQRCTWG